MQLVVGGRLRLDKGRHAIGVAPVHAVKHQAMQMYVELGGGAKALDQRDGAALTFVCLQPGAVQQVARDQALHHLQHRRDQFRLSGRQLVVATLAAAQPEEAVSQDAARQEGVELLLEEPGQLATGAGFGVGDEAGRVLLHQAVQRALLWSMALVVDRGAIGHPLWVPADGLHARLPKW